MSKQVVKQEEAAPKPKWEPPRPTKNSKKIKIRALSTGFYINRRIRKGEVAYVFEEYFSEKWMERFDADKEAKQKEQELLAQAEGDFVAPDYDPDLNEVKSVGPKVVSGPSNLVKQGQPRGKATGDQKVI